MDKGPQLPRQPYYKPHTSIGAIGHWVKTAGILAPLVIGKFVKDPDQRWRLIRIAAVATALLSEGMDTHRIRKEREEAGGRLLATVRIEPHNCRIFASLARETVN